MITKFINATVLTMDGAGIIYNGTIIVDGGYIKYVGSSYVGEADKIVDVSGDILMPGFINSHAHLAMSLLRTTAEDYELSDWLNKAVFPVEAKMNADDVYYGTMLSLGECAMNGITTVADSYYFNESAAAAANETGLNLVILGADMDIKQSAESVVKKIGDDYSKYNKKKGCIKYIPGCHSVYTCSDKLLMSVADFCFQTKSMSYIHLSETLKEVGDCTVQRGGLTPPQYLHKIGYFVNGGIAAHGVYLDKDDIDLIKDTVSISHCPGSNLKLGSGIAPVYSMLLRGMNVCLGTDGSASNNSLDILKEAYLTSVIQKGILNNPEVIEPFEALKMATVNGAAALGLKNTGKLAENYKADIIRISMKNPRFYPRFGNAYSSLLYSGRGNDVIMTMCGGKIVYDGESVLIKNYDKILNECDMRAKKLLKSI